MAASFTQPFLTSQVDVLGVLTLLEARKEFSPKPGFIRPRPPRCSARCRLIPQDEKTPFYPEKPLRRGETLAAHWMTVNYRESYDLFSCSGILFNHESPLRAAEIRERKITMGAGARKTR